MIVRWKIFKFCAFHPPFAKDNKKKTPRVANSQNCGRKNFPYANLTLRESIVFLTYDSHKVKVGKRESEWDRERERGKQWRKQNKITTKQRFLQIFGIIESKKKLLQYFLEGFLFSYKIYLYNERYLILTIFCCCCCCNSFTISPMWVEMWVDAYRQLQCILTFSLEDPFTRP